MSLRVIFMGTPDFAVPVLTRIAEQGHDIAAVYTQPPRPAGRGQAERKSPVHQAAEVLGVEVRTPKNFKNAADRHAFDDLKADVAVVVAYGLLLPKPILDAPTHGCLNLHGSLLPRWRGAAPIQRAIMAGDDRTGVMVMQMDEGLDTGPVAMTAEIPIGPDMTAGELHDEMMQTGAALMGEALEKLEAGTLTFTPQPDDGATYAKKIDKAEARIDWSLPASEVHNRIRGLSPFPGAWFEYDHNDKPVRVKVLRAALAGGSGEPGELINDPLTIACGTGAVELQVVQREGRGSMDAADFVRGAGDISGKILV